MIEQLTLEHHIQKSIMEVLVHHQFARFSDMRPNGVDTNLYTYHLKLLQKRGFVAKAVEGYTLGRLGVVYVDRFSELEQERWQPKIITMHVIKNSDGDVLLYQRDRQPFTHQMTLVYGRVRLSDASIEAAAQRVARERLGLEGQDMIRAGDCYIRVHDAGEVMMSTLAHVFYYLNDTIVADGRLEWVRPHKLEQYELAPGVNEIISRTFFRDPYFFEEYNVELRET